MGLLVRAVLVVSLACAPIAVAACGTVLGIDDGIPKGDGGGNDATQDDSTTGDDTGDAADAQDSADEPDTSDSGDDGDACTPDPNWCNGHCLDSLDNCGQQRSCLDCAFPNVCNVNHQCQCAADPNYCANRCGMTTDNCGTSIDCGSCDGGLTCTSNSCGCVPQTESQACGSRVCGAVTNNCGQTQGCGPNGSQSCAINGEVCLSGGTCCAPNNAGACNGRCNGVLVTNSCGQQVHCPLGCPGGEVCVTSSDTCCKPDNSCQLHPCVGTNNCEQPCACDGGPIDAGGCGPTGAPCSVNGNCCSSSCLQPPDGGIGTCQ